MNAAATLALAVLGVVAPANWWSRWSGRRAVEVVTKPVATALVLLIAVVIDADSDPVRAWFVVALALSLAGDVFLLLDPRWFLAGLAAFLLAHVAYIVGFVVADDWRWWWAVASLLPIAALATAVGRPILRSVGHRSVLMQTAVAAYLVTILTMFASSCAAGPPAAIAGAALFVASDSILGWREFVADRRWMAPLVMVTYHTGQLLLALSLL